MQQRTECLRDVPSSPADPEDNHTLLNRHPVLYLPVRHWSTIARAAAKIEIPCLPSQRCPHPIKGQLLIKSFRLGVPSLLALIASAGTVFRAACLYQTCHVDLLLWQCQPGQPVSSLVEVRPGTFVGSLTFGAIYTISSAQQFQVLYTLPGLAGRLFQRCRNAASGERREPIHPVDF